MEGYIAAALGDFDSVGLAAHVECVEFVPVAEEPG